MSAARPNKTQGRCSLFQTAGCARAANARAQRAPLTKQPAPAPSAAVRGRGSNARAEACVSSGFKPTFSVPIGMEMPVDSPGKGNRVISGIELAEYVASTRADAINRSDATALIACTQENASCSGRSKM